MMPSTASGACTVQSRLDIPGRLTRWRPGVLVMLVGRAVKCAEFFDGKGGIVDSGKSYRAVLRLGIATDTGDITGNVTATSDAIPDEDEVLAAIKGFEGDIMQVPPMYQCSQARRRQARGPRAQRHHNRTRASPGDNP